MPTPPTMPRFHVGCRLGLLDKSNFVCAQASNASESDCILISNPRGFLNHTKFILLSNQIYFLFLFFWSQTILAKHDWKISTYKVKSKSSKWLLPGSPRLPEIDPRFPQNFHAVSLRLPLVAQWLPCCCPEVTLRLPWSCLMLPPYCPEVVLWLPAGGCPIVVFWFSEVDSRGYPILWQKPIPALSRNILAPFLTKALNARNSGHGHLHWSY